MKILKANAGPLTNLEVLEFLRSRGAGKDPTRVIAPVAPSEFKVFDYLEQSAIRNQTRESINEFVVKSKKYNFSKAETLNIINNVPSSAPELYTMVTESTSHVKDEDELAALLEEMVAMVAEVFSLNKMEPGDGACEEDIEELVAS